MNRPAQESSLFDSFQCSGTSPPSQAPGARTAAVRAGIATETQHGAVVPPLYLSTNYTFSGFNQKRAYDYTRSGNPTRDELGSALARLEGGAGGIVTSSGMSAVLLATQLAGPRDLIVAPHDCYGGTYRLLSKLSERGSFSVCFVDENDPAAVDAALARTPKLVWIETPSNPLLRITDIRQLASLAHQAGAIVVADNTFLSPALQRPLDLGADLIVHSTTKYLNGHSDVVGGAAISKTQALHQELSYWANCLGLTGAPFDSYLTLRGLRTLHARLAVHQQNASAIADLLIHHPAVAEVHYPGLSAHPGHEIARKQQTGFGAMVSFALKGDTSHVRAFLDELTLFSLAESLGGVESLIAHPATMTHAAMDPQARQRAGIGDTLLRLSVGIEDTSDLLRDLERALDRVANRNSAAVTGAAAPAAVAEELGS
ncbi:MAG: cystathionine gamma-synthase [Deltaproteobacteria bacterium]|nr:cystathionine gamma-synthase [Deltaproteobacteria bacterium]